MSPPLGQKSRPPLGIWELAWPAILGNLLYSLVGFVDIKIVGSLGASAIAAVTTGYRIFFVLQAILMAVTVGTTALVARAWGAGDRDEAELVTRASLWVCIAVAAVTSLPGLLYARELAGIFDLEPETLDLAAVFIRRLSLFNVAFAIPFALGTAVRAAGDTRTPLWIGALTNVVNVILLYVLVYGRFGVPSLGVGGAAIANGCAFAVGSAVFLWLWLRGGLVLGVGPPRALEPARIRRLFHIGYPAALEQGVWQGGFIGFLWIIALYGTAPYAAYGIGVNILSFSFVVGFGFSIAASTLVGQHLGAGDLAGAARSGWRATGLSVLAMSVFGLAIVLASEAIASFLIDDPEVVRLTVVFIYILGSVQPLMALEFTLGGALRGAGDTRFPLIAVMTGLLGVRVVLAGFFAWRGFPVEWIFAALIGDYIVKASMLTWRFRSGRWQTIIRDAPASS
ncbi:MAG: MATE family efflux transporter [Proteobacteria bacterium]|nr:MATE family efflux transporter [Pseudomonadota bacterium]